MFRCSDRKRDWYLTRGLAEQVPPDLYGPSVEGAHSIRLLFEPKGTGRNRAGDEWYLEDQQDKCVVCGHENADDTVDEDNYPIGLTLHHVVPYQYRREMPVSFKSHGSHDVLVLCVPCHESYERHADKEKLRLCELYNAPLIGRGWIKWPRHGSIKTNAVALARYKHQIPQRRIEELQRNLMDFYNLDCAEDITDEILNAAMELKIAEKGADFQEHGSLVIRAIDEHSGEEGFSRFVRFWRQHFLDTMRPRYLSKQWKVDDPVNLVAGEYNPYRPEMDGS